MTKKTEAAKTGEAHRKLQQHIDEADKHAPTRDGNGAMQAGARDYPAPPFPKQHQLKPGLD